MESNDKIPPVRKFTWLIFLLFAAALAAVAALGISAHRRSRVPDAVDESNAAGFTEEPLASAAAPSSSAWSALPTYTSASDIPQVSVSPEITSPAEPTPGPFVKTAVYIDGVKSRVLSSRQAAESLISSVTYYFESLDIIPPGAVTVLQNEVELKEADPEDETVDYDTAFAYFTGAATPLSYRSDVTFYQDNVIEHTDTIEYSDLLPESFRIVKVYGCDGINRIIYGSTYINGIRREIYEQERATVYPAIDGVTIIGTAKLAAGGVPPYNFGEAAPLQAGFVLSVPVSGIVFGFYGMNDDGFHNGIDIACAAGTEVCAAGRGTVVSIIERGAYGLMVDIDHGGGVTTRYARLDRVSVAVGDKVSAGHSIGVVSDNLRTPHLHFELRCDNYAYNPLLSFVDIEKLDLTYAVNG